MEKGFRLTVFTEEKALLDLPVESIIAPGSEGYLGVLRQHAPLVTALVPGKLTVRDLEGKTEIYALSGGFLEVSGNVVTILAQTIEKAVAIDVTRAGQAAERARRWLAERGATVDVARAEAALRRALNRLRVAQDLERVG